MEALDKLLGASPTTVLVLGAVIVLLVYLIPKAVSKMGVHKIAGIELTNAQDEFTRHYNVDRQIEHIDTETKEELWEFTEDLLLDASESSVVTCDAAVGHILGGVFSHLRNHIMMNHLSTKLALENEEQFRTRLLRNVRVTVGNARKDVIDTCPVVKELDALDISRYSAILDTWLEYARACLIKACRRKIALYEVAYKDSRADYWKSVYKSCVDKNEAYIVGMSRK